MEKNLFKKKSVLYKNFKLSFYNYITYPGSRSKMLLHPLSTLIGPIKISFSQVLVMQFFIFFWHFSHIISSYNISNNSLISYKLFHLEMTKEHTIEMMQKKAKLQILVWKGKYAKYMCIINLIQAQTYIMCTYIYRIIIYLVCLDLISLVQFMTYLQMRYLVKIELMTLVVMCDIFDSHHYLCSHPM